MDNDEDLVLDDVLSVSHESTPLAKTSMPLRTQRRALPQERKQSEKRRKLMDQAASCVKDVVN